MVKDANKLSQQAPKAYTKKTLAPPKQVVKHIQMVFVYCDDTSKPQTCPHNKQQFQRRQMPKHARWTEAPTLQVELDYLIFWQVKDLVLEKTVANRREKQQIFMFTLYVTCLAYLFFLNSGRC